MNKIMDQLRRRNKRQYRTLSLCIILSIVMITSFAIIYFCPSMQKLLPSGGDTRKLYVLLFGVIILGCMVFTSYGARLFFRYKSKELGVFLALGETKKRLNRALISELFPMLLYDVTIGIVVAIPISYFLWQGLKLILPETSQMHYQISIYGIAMGIIYALMLIICVRIVGKGFMRKTNLCDILYEEKKTEMVRTIHPAAGKIGIVLIVFGLLLAIGVPPIASRVFHRLMPKIWNATYLISAFGLYIFLLGVVGSTKKGKHKEKYYSNIVSVNMMRFTARQTTKNMCVMVFILFVMIQSTFWGIQYLFALFTSSNYLENDFMLHYPAVEKQIQKKEIFELSEQYHTPITFYEEADALQLIVCYKEKDLIDNVYVDGERHKLASFFSESDYERITGQQVEVQKGQYLAITAKDYVPTIWNQPDCLKNVSNPVTKESIMLTFSGTVEFSNIAQTSDPFAFILDDEDYHKMSENITKKNLEHLIFFNVENADQSYSFAMALRDEYVSRATEVSDYYTIYDSYEEEEAIRSGKEYSYSEPFGIVDDSSETLYDWKYAPVAKILVVSESMQMVAVFIMLSICITLIAMVGIAMMTYTRCITIAMDNKKLYEDLKRLGANENYRKKTIVTQLKKIFTYPAIAGNLLSLVFTLFLLYFNNMNFERTDLMMLTLEVVFMLFVVLFLYIMYRISYRSMCRILSIEGKSE